MKGDDDEEVRRTRRECASTMRSPETTMSLRKILFGDELRTVQPDTDALGACGFLGGTACPDTRDSLPTGIRHTTCHH
ncbi:unnamed protein product [Gongylonema pulchrum]|uniref:Uncharacterized protein n=1 Tax=Gongylonema pulchrum TaxID=637853 RepID=A0A183EH01_9BILA|nr:unnamed protein product [Gongylonema pulchrum]